MRTILQIPLGHDIAEEPIRTGSCLSRILLQDTKNVYFLTEFLGGGDLFTAIREIGNLSKRQSQSHGWIVHFFLSGVLWIATNYFPVEAVFI